MKENEERTVKICFDLQQVQNLPKLPNQETYYSHQIALYAFLLWNTKNLTFYIWTEEKSGRGLIERGSALLNYLRESDLNDIRKLHFFADGCGGQNKNSHIIHLLMYWLHKESPQNVEEIKRAFPVTARHI
ncbi:hypothetical protein ILUMI_12088 [Ignelater luminosus]|uniref:Uncharacterized protein n=1 Tax=Ignelater luminosus TaxID=2038154 RepID=A0A8K0D079_IGNLU|nr:hypothetical protein ILUMI_12088 [Ignelater luminosus]